jgi:nucleoid-associated protein YgaU
MPNDAKLGLVVGVGLVIAIAVVFFRRDSPAADPVHANLKQTPAPALFPGPAARSRPVAARSGIRTASTPTPGDARCHTVRAGETLYSLARHYYGSQDKADFLFEANRNKLTSPESLEPGTELVIPDLPPETEPREEP